MIVERRKYKDADGKDRQSTFWSCRLDGWQGRRPRVKLFKAKSASEHAARQIARLVDAKSGGEPLSAEMLKWVGDLPPRILQRLISLKVVDPRRISSTVPIEEHVAAWERWIANGKRTEEHLKTTTRNVRATLAGCGITRWCDLEARAVKNWLAERTGPEGWSVRTHNAYVQSIRQFAQWMVTHELAVINPLLSLSTIEAGAEADVRRPRRALTIEEAERLVAAAVASTRHIERVSPATRALIYRIMLLTGLRFGETIRLQVGWIQFGSEGRPTTITPPASATKAGKKSGRVDVILVPAQLEASLVDATRGKLPKALLVEREGGRIRNTAIPKGTGSKLIKHDLAAAGIPYVDEAGRYADAHSLRHTALTWFARTGASMDDLLPLFRHSNPQVAAGYIHSVMEGRRSIVDRLPQLGESGRPHDDSEPLKKAAGAELSGSSLGADGSDPTGSGGTVSAPDGPQLIGKCGSTGDFQSSALPTELSRRLAGILFCRRGGVNGWTPLLPAESSKLTRGEQRTALPVDRQGRGPKRKSTNSALHVVQVWVTGLADQRNQTG